MIFYAGILKGSVQGSVLRYVVAAAFVILLYLSVLIHELSHCAVARAFRLPVRRILLYPLGGLSEIEQEPQTPARAFLVSGAGPLLSLALAALGYGIIVAFGPGGIPRILIDQLILANIVIGVLNLLPGLPLDGGWMVRAAVWKLTGKPGTGTIAAAWAGRGLAVALLAVPLAIVLRNGSGSGIDLVNVVWLGAIAAFMWVSAGQSIRATRVRERLPGLQARRAPASEYLLIEPSGQVFGVLATSDLDHAFAGT